MVVDDALMNVHGTARFFFHRLRHERGIHVVPQCGFACGSFEKKCLVRDLDRITMHQVDLHLGRTCFVIECLKRDIEDFAVVV